MAAGFERALALQIQRLRQQRGDRVDILEVEQLVRGLWAQLSLGSSTADLTRELESLSAYIQNAKAELAQLRPHDISARYIASATDELDAIVGATETATNTILDTAEQLQDLSLELEPSLAKRLSNATTTIFEACNFQDITGQRITKVVGALKHIEQRIEALMAAFGTEHAPPPTPAPVAERPSDADLLNGPQLADKAQDQAAIDALFNQD